MNDRTRLSHDRTRRSTPTPARQVTSKDDLEAPNHYWTCPLAHDRTHVRVWSSFVSHKRLHQRTSALTGRTSVVSGHFFATTSGLRPKARPFTPTLTGRREGESGHHMTCVRSLFHSEKHLLHFTNFSTLAQMCQPSVSPYARVLAYFHKDFQGC
jgi:hypothetical protein